MSSSSIPHTLKVYPCGGQGYIGKLDYAPLATTASAAPISSPTASVHTIVVLDRSGSMGNNVERLVNRVLPQLFERLQYAAQDPITLFAFDNEARTVESTVQELKQVRMVAGGATHMSTALHCLNSWLHERVRQHDRRPIRVLTISDGDVHDMSEVLALAPQIAAYIRQSELVVNSQAVRLFTSSGQPDTRAVASVLQLNTMSASTLVDMVAHASETVLAQQMEPLFAQDGLKQSIELASTEAVFLATPWDKEAAQLLRITPGENTFWLRTIPNQLTLTTDASLPVQYVGVQVKETLTFDTYSSVLRTKIEYFMNQLSLLKVMNTASASEQIGRIVTYFSDMEKVLVANEGDMQLLLSSGRLRARLDYFRQKIVKSQRSVAQRMSELASDERVAQFNSAQSAEYLRTVTNTRNARGLVRRANTAGTDFNTKAREEVRAMAAHLDHLKDVDDSKHQVSFYSQGTTLEGIRTVCDLVTQNLLDDVDAPEIVQLLNIVGVACQAPIGEFPDPITWRVTQMHPGCYVSLSDVLIVEMNKEVLKTPGTSAPIVNVIPMFEDARIQRFLQKHAPSLLQYTCGIGMRRMLADIPMTYEYTIVAGIWQMVPQLNLDKSTLAVQTWVALIQTFQRATGNYFQYNVADVGAPTDPTRSYFISGDGVTKMVSPLLTLLGDEHKRAYIPAILRALYTYETWQALRRGYKNAPNPGEAAQEQLHRLIGLNMERDKTAVRPLFEPEPQDPHFHDQYEIVDDEFRKNLKEMWYINALTLLPAYLEVARQVLVDPQYDAVQAMRSVPELSSQTARDALQLVGELDEFQFFNMVQALQYTTTAQRLDKENKRMLMTDVGLVDRAQTELRAYVRAQFKQQYDADCAYKAKQEQEVLCTELVQSLVSSTTLAEYVQLLQQGVTRGGRTCQLVNRSSAGFVELQASLFDVTRAVPLRPKKLEVLLLGRDLQQQDVVVWNGGNVVMGVNMLQYAQVYRAGGGTEEGWAGVRDFYKRNYRITYRDGQPNRHSHSNNKVSFYALGYNTLEEYRAAVSSSEWHDYLSEHPDCCGTKRITHAPLSLQEKRARKKQLKTRRRVVGKEN